MHIISLWKLGIKKMSSTNFIVLRDIPPLNACNSRTTSKILLSKKRSQWGHNPRICKIINISKKNLPYNKNIGKALANNPITNKPNNAQNKQGDK